MTEIRSAWEKAMEKAEKLGKLSTEELNQLKYVPLGNTIASKYLQGESQSLSSELDKFENSNAKKYVTEGLQEILLRNILLPKNDKAKQVTKRAMKGLRELKKDKKRVEVIFEQIEHLFAYYEKAHEQSYLQLKRKFEEGLREPTQALEQQLKMKVTIKPELHPQFQEEWHRLSNELDTQYEKVLMEQKQQLLTIA